MAFTRLCLSGIQKAEALSFAQSIDLLTSLFRSMFYVILSGRCKNVDSFATLA